MLQLKRKFHLKKMECLGFEPVMAVWKAQTNPLSYGGNSDTKPFVIRRNSFAAFELNVSAQNRPESIQSISLTRLKLEFLRHKNETTENEQKKKERGEGQDQKF